MNRDKYEEAWTKLLAARRGGSFQEVWEAAERLAHEAKILHRDQLWNEPEEGPCSHFMVANGHCINCHQFVGSKGN